MLSLLCTWWLREVGSDCVLPSHVQYWVTTIPDQNRMEWSGLQSQDGWQQRPCAMNATPGILAVLIFCIRSRWTCLIFIVSYWLTPKGIVQQVVLGVALAKTKDCCTSITSVMWKDSVSALTELMQEGTWIGPSCVCCCSKHFGFFSSDHDSYIRFLSFSVIGCDHKTLSAPQAFWGWLLGSLSSSFGCSSSLGCQFTGKDHITKTLPGLQT
jgi:hypothetical protein